MRTFARKPKTTQPPSSTKSSALSRTPVPQWHDLNSIRYLQRTIGNQAPIRLVQSNGEERDAVMTGKAFARFGHDFARIPVSPPALGALQTKLSINEPGDQYEQEAERVAEQVMRMPESQKQPACPCGGGCPKCQTNRPSQKHERLQTKRVQASDTGMRAALPSVHEVLAVPGQPLDPTIRDFMEPRFGLDLSKVRVHSGAAAERSARDMGAHAYTVGHNIVFGAGQFVPGTTEGKRLLAHELTHVIQQGRTIATGPGQESTTHESPGNGPPSGSAGPLIQRYTAFSVADQTTGKSLGWVHPASEKLRVSDDGALAVEDKGWNPGSNKLAWATKAEVKQSNDILRSIGSNTKLAEKAGTLTGKPPANAKGPLQTLVEIEPQKASGVGTFTLISDCGSACKQVMGSHGGTDVAVVGKSGQEKYTSARTYHGGTPTTPEEFFQEILTMEFGSALTRSELYDKYSKLTAAQKDAFDRKYGINKYATPRVGQGQTISTETDMPGFATVGPMTWNFHYAATLLRSGPDQVTLESAAGWGATDWIFYMYGPASKAQSFHEEHGAMGSHGTHFTTMVVQPEAQLKGKTSAAGVHLVSDTAKWDTTLIAKLPTGTDVYTLQMDRHWLKVRVETGAHAGKVGWIMRRFFSQ